MIKVSQLHIYPVKSLGGISVGSALLTPKGLQYDRNWMILDANGQFMTQRKVPEMTQIIPEIKDNALHLWHKPSGQRTSIPIQEEYGENIQTKVWSDDCTLQRVGQSVDEFLSDCLDRTCSLYFFPAGNKRTRVHSEGVYSYTSSLADKSPILLANTASVQELNTRLGNEIQMSRFRANIIYEGEQAWEEDHFGDLQIGNTTLKRVELCGRCPLINVDQATGHTSKEPLQTLLTYRKNHETRRVEFGVRYDSLVDLQEAQYIRIGDVLNFK